jgi:hypothetical protein
LLLSPRPPLERVGRGLFGLSLSPLAAMLALVAQISLRGEGGDDCLGYTVIARPPGARPAKA